MDEYLHRTARQHDEGRNANIFIWATEDNTVAGYCSIRINSQLLLTKAIKEEVPKKLRKSIDKYGGIPVILLAWLGRDKKFRGKSLGQDILKFVIEKAIETNKSTPLFGIVTDPLTTNSREWFKKQGFTELSDSDGRMFLRTDNL